MKTVIEVRNISKRYSIGRHESFGSLREEVMQSLTAPFRRFFNGTKHALNGGQEIFWALKDVSFDVNKGDVLGIIGSNGAGKSTLLKILSRIVEPTEGSAVIKGRVVSLLEVGTGFHPELTGRENIFLNGSLLGMSNAEIRRKFDEIVAFSEIEKFLDTPVKRYSSGMYVRLAFAVAAHLDPEILILDEVLAVGDARFQKKCLGKMGEVAKGGRTVLFVSHNLAAVKSLCTSAILLVNGSVVKRGDVQGVVEDYLSGGREGEACGEICWNKSSSPGGEDFRLVSIRLLDVNDKVCGNFDIEKSVRVEMTYELSKAVTGMRLVLQILNSEGVVAFSSTDHHSRGEKAEIGLYRTVCTIPGGLLNSGVYHVKIHAGCPGVKVLLEGREFLKFIAEETGHHGSFYPEKWPGVVAPKLHWETQMI